MTQDTQAKAFASPVAVNVGGTGKRSKFKPIVRSVVWDQLPPKTQEFLATFGLRQVLANAAIGADTQTGFEAQVDKKLGDLMSGTLSGSRGVPKAKPDTEEARATKLAKAAIRAAMKAAGKEAPGKDALDAAAAKLLASAKGDSFREEAKSQLAAEAKLAEAEGDLDDILADLIEAEDAAAEADDTDESGEAGAE